jgi:hypothetical protein
MTLADLRLTGQRPETLQAVGDAGRIVTDLARYPIIATEKNGAFRTLRVKETDTLKDIYAKVRRSFTAADLARCIDATFEPGIPAEELMAQLEAVHKDELQKMRKKKQKKRS